MLTRLYLARAVRHYRTAQGLSMEKLASMAGIRRLTVQQIESAKANPRLSTIIALAYTLNVSVQELLRHRLSHEELTELKIEARAEMRKDYQREYDERHREDLP